MEADAPHVSVSASHLEGAKALACRLRFDALQWRAGALTPGDLWGAPEGVVSLAVEHEPGVVDIGIALAHWDKRAGLRGRGELARLELLPREGAHRQPSAQAAPSCLTGLVTIERPAGILSWPWVFIGDYDLNGEVNISDLTPLAMRLGNTVDGPLADAVPYEVDPDVVCDGDLNREVNISDLSQIGQHFGQTLTGFQVFKSSDWWLDYPRPQYAAPTLTPVTEATAADVIPGTSDTRPRIALTVNEEPLGEYWWVVPFGSGWTGPASNSALETGVEPGRHDPDYGLKWEAASSTLSWNWNMAADYQANAYISLGDLTPIGTHLGNLTVNDRSDERYSLDGCRDGVINMADLAPIGALYGQSTSGFEVFSAISAAEIPVNRYETPASPPIATWSAFPDPLSVELPGLAPGTYLWIRPATGSGGLAASSEVIQIP